MTSSWGGGEKQLFLLHQGLSKEKYPQLIVCRSNSLVEKECIKRGIPYIAMKKGLLGFFAARKLYHSLQTFKPNIIHAHDSHAHTVSVLCSLLYRTSVEIFVSRKVAFPVKKSPLSLYKYNHPKIKKFLCVSHYVSDVLSPVLKNPDKIEVVYDAIDIPSTEYFNFSKTMKHRIKRIH